MDVNDLINPLRYVNLKEIDPQSINRMGEGVFPEPGTLDHLRIIDLVTKAYQGDHMPSLGMPIPVSSKVKNVTLSGTSNELLSAAKNEVLEIISINAANPNEYGLSAGALFIYPNGDDAQEYPIYEFIDIDELANSFSGVMYGACANNGKLPITPGQPLFLNGGDSLGLLTKSSPDPSMTLQIIYRKRIQ